MNLVTMQEHLRSLTDVVTKVLNRSASVDPGALINTLNDIKSHTSAQLQALEANAKVVDQRTYHLVEKSARRFSFGFWTYLGFVLLQSVALGIYYLITKRLDRNKKYL